MQKKDYLSELHLGKIIKEVALQKKVSSKILALEINYNSRNADKIFQMKNMDVEKVIKISYLLEYNFLFFLAKEYLPHLSYTDMQIENETCLINVDINNKFITINNPTSDCGFLKALHLGNYIKEIAKNRKYRVCDVAKLLDCSPNMVSYLYKCKSLSVKKIIHISEVFQYDFITNVYLSKIFIPNSLFFLENCIITVNRKNIRIINTTDNTCMLYLYRIDTK